MTVNLKEAMKKISAEKRERKKLVTQGVSSYPIKLYQVFIILKQDKKYFVRSFFTVGFYENEMRDKFYVMQEVQMTIAEIKIFYHTQGKDIKHLGTQVELIGEY